MRLTNLHELDREEGTVQLRRAFNDNQVHKTKDEILLHPTPSATDPNDPLRWPRWRKHAAFLPILLFGFFVNYGAGGFAPAFPRVAREFHTNQQTTQGLSLWALFALGLFNFFWIPVGAYIGKRPVFIFTSILAMCGWIWSASSRSFESLLWSRLVACFAGSASEALGVSVINDLYFLHERASMMGLYHLFISCGNSIGPIVAGFVTEYLGWRWVNWIVAIAAGVNVIVFILLFPETRYDRSQIVVPSSPPSYQDTKGDKTSSASKSFAQEDVQVSSINSQEVELEQQQKKSFKASLKPWSSINRQDSLLLAFIRPWPLLCYPSVILSTLAYSTTLAWIVFVNITNPFVFQAPPYLWSPSVNSLINIPGIIGNAVGAFTGGYLVDKYCLWASKRNNGIFEPEMRLVLLIIPILLMPAGCLAFGYGVGERLNWTAAFFGYGLMSVALDAVPSITFTYISDCVLPVSSDALLLVNGLKNIIAFGFIYGVVPWIQHSGYINVTGTQAGIYVALVGIPSLIVWKYGRRMRHASNQWKVVLVKH